MPSRPKSSASVASSTTEHHGSRRAELSRDGACPRRVETATLAAFIGEIQRRLSRS
jgi:hypothetical protein